MAKKTATHWNSPRLKEAAGLFLIAAAVACLVSLWSYSGGDPTWFKHHDPATGPARNGLGAVGANTAEILLQLFGAAAFLFPALIGLLGWSRFRRRDRPLDWARVGAGIALVLALCSMLQLLYDPIVYGGERFQHAGGYLGSRVAGVLTAIGNTAGAYLVTTLALLAIITLTARESFERTVAWASPHVRGAVGSAGAAIGGWFADRHAERRRRRAAAASPAPAPRRPSGEAPGPRSEPRPSIAPRDPATAVAPRLLPKPAPPRSPLQPPQPSKPKQSRLPMERGKRGYVLPGLDLLNEAQIQERESEQELLERANQITEKFAEFAIDGAVVAIHPGPVVTTFEFRPEAGVKYSKITGMTDDLSLALRAESVRIDRLPGRSTVGIEVPNNRQETIYPRELLGSEPFRRSDSKLALALGKDIHGEVNVAELDRMPHLLIAGATGAGKSVGLNGMIVSMLFKATPAELRFIMIDTKMIELGVYQGIPHLLIPVVTDPKHASAALKWAVKEMEARYKKLAAVGVRNLMQFNELLDNEPGKTIEDPRSEEPVELTKLPYIVVVIDEMADLMMVSSADVEESVMRLAQMARAVGIHLILATQRPSVDVITGTIKANFPSRIAFRVSQRVDSRTIIDQQGAEHLLGRGDMLYLATGSSRLRRMHSGFFTEVEIHRICTFLKKMAEPVYDDTVLKEAEEGRGGPGDPGSERDEMYVDAVRTVIQEGKCSITLIQRRLQLGYARAARIVDVMEREGVVSPGEGSKPREVLVGEDILETLEAQK